MNKKPRQKVHLKCTRGNFNISTKENTRNRHTHVTVFLQLHSYLMSTESVMHVYC